jgi:hypothetical protein
MLLTFSGNCRRLVSLESKKVAATTPSYLARNVKFNNDFTDKDVKGAKDIEEAVACTGTFKQIKRKKR